jgi:hypothetical protein
MALLSLLSSITGRSPSLKLTMNDDYHLVEGEGWCRRTSCVMLNACDLQKYLGL